MAAKSEKNAPEKAAACHVVALGEKCMATLQDASGTTVKFGGKLEMMRSPSMDATMAVPFARYPSPEPRTVLHFVLYLVLYLELDLVLHFMPTRMNGWFQTSRHSFAIDP